jgi:hypothetical protein
MRQKNPNAQMAQRVLTKDRKFSRNISKRIKKRLAFFEEMVYTRKVCKSKIWEVIP